MNRKRCAIYTRKSTEEGLEQGFNSLDAQREACEAFISSQRHEGWSLVKKDYDDGGYSGGTINRPALQVLLGDIKSGLIDVIVVYKIDRLTRSLTDFAKMVDVFDAKAVSFVSVTQQFNTTTSMGRLTLNVLLSFAQFEREVTAERIRDKIAASKKKGLWMGGQPPLGYDVRDKMLVVNAEEAQQVRRLFEAYLELGSTKALTAWAIQNNITTKLRIRADGTRRAGGKAFCRGNLHALLHYRTYVGQVAHAGKVYDGNHDAILTRAIWDEVQAKLENLRQSRRVKRVGTRSKALTGLLFDETGDRLTPVHATKQKKRYHYYISRRLIETDSSDASGWRLPAGTVETAVADGIMAFLQDTQALVEVLQGGDHRPRIEAHLLNQIIKSVNQLVDQTRKLAEADRLSLVLPLVERIDIRSGHMIIAIRIAALRKEVCLGSPPGDGEQGAIYNLDVPFQVKRRGVETHLVVTNGSTIGHHVDQTLVQSIAKARRWFLELSENATTSVKTIAAREKIAASEVSRQLPLAFLSPTIVTKILQGHQPIDLTTKRLQRLSNLPLDWAEQARLLGFGEL